MVEKIKEHSWLADLIIAFNELGGEANYQKIYQVTKRNRLARGGNWTPSSDATIRRTVEDNAKESDNFRGREVFYSVSGMGNGRWGLLPHYLAESAENTEAISGHQAYVEGLEGIAREAKYLRKSRDPKLVEQRKLRDDFTCQSCGYRKQIGPEQYIIDVHHLNPIGELSGVTITSINDLVCLCPNCHRIAHTKVGHPFSMEKIRLLAQLVRK